MVKYFSMFSGIGGFELGIQRAFDGKGAGRFGQEESISESDSTDTRSQSNERQYPSCVGYSEIDKYAIKVYERHFGNGKSNNEYAHISEESKQEERTQGRKRSTDKQSVLLHDRNGSTPLCNTNGGHTNYGDATTINAKELPDFDLLVGGFPCQAFSVAGKRKGFDDTRGTLFFDIARILAEKRPRHLLLENVKGLLNHDKGKTFQTILGVLSDLGYRVEWQVLNSKDFGVPQNRERIFIVGHLRGECGRKVFPITGNSPKTIEQGLVTVSAATGVKDVNLSPTLDTMYKKGLGSKQARPAVINQLNQPTHSNDRVYGTDGVSPTLNTMQGGNRQPFLSLEKLKQEQKIRRLTPKECERLQGFPDDWTKDGVVVDAEWEKGKINYHFEPISDTQRYKMCGNAVTVNVIEAIIREFKCL